MGCVRARRRLTHEDTDGDQVTLCVEADWSACCRWLFNDEPVTLPSSPSPATLSRSCIAAVSLGARSHRWFQAGACCVSLSKCPAPLPLPLVGTLCPPPRAPSASPRLLHAPRHVAPVVRARPWLRRSPQRLQRRPAVVVAHLVARRSWAVPPPQRAAAATAVAGRWQPQPPPQASPCAPNRRARGVRAAAATMTGSCAVGRRRQRHPKPRRNRVTVHAPPAAL